MYKYAIRWLCAIALLVSAGSARAVFHLWQLNEFYSNADGSVQYIELRALAGGQQFLAGHSITSSQGATTQIYTFPADLPGDTTGRTFLIGTTGFAALGLVMPDYIVPNGFLFTTNGSVNFAGVDSSSWAALPVDGVTSIDRFGATGVNSPQNFAGASGSVAPAPSPACTLTATPASIEPGGTSVLTASCSPAATSYVWSANTGFGSTVAVGTVAPTVTSTYTVSGVNGAGTGAAASATVTVTAASAPTFSLENPQPGSFQSGIGLISGWSCQGSSISVSIDNGAQIPPIFVPYGSSRPDTAGVCGAFNTNTGFGLLVNFNRLGNGTHTAQVLVNGVPQGTPTQFTVTAPAGEFLTGASGQITVPDFPSTGRTTTLIWQESQQNFAIRSVTP